MSAALFLLVALVAILGFAPSAQAASVPLLEPVLSALPPGAPEDEEEAEAAEAEEEEVEVCEETEEGVEECVVVEEKSESKEAADACMVKSANATVLVLPAKNTVRLTLRYTTFAPAVVSVRYGLRGRKGNVKMGAESSRFSRKGVFHKTEKLSEKEMAKAVAATEFDVRVHAVNAPGYCRKLFDLELNSRSSARSRASWTD